MIHREEKTSLYTYNCSASRCGCFIARIAKSCLKARSKGRGEDNDSFFYGRERGLWRTASPSSCGLLWRVSVVPSPRRDSCLAASLTFSGCSESIFFSSTTLFLCCVPVAVVEDREFALFDWEHGCECKRYFPGYLYWVLALCEVFCISLIWYEVVAGDAFRLLM